MSNNSYITITEARKQELQDNFTMFVGTHGNLQGAFELHPLLNQKFLAGFEVRYSDYIGIVSNVGVQQWLVRFGYSNDPNLGVKFCLIITGIDGQGQVVSPNYQLLTPVCGIIEPFEVEVPGNLSNQWQAAWSNLQEVNNVPKDICQNSYGILQGYNFSTSDFLDLLNYQGPCIPEETVIDFTLVNHAESKVVPPEQLNVPGTLGVMVALTSIIQDSGSTTRVLLSDFYDISSPCPPTCP